MFLFVCLFFAVRRPLTAVASPVAEQQALDAQAQWPLLTGAAAPRHVGSSQTAARTRVPCIGRRTPNHCATREAQNAPSLNYGMLLKILIQFSHAYTDIGKLLSFTNLKQ